jgi:LDH2 family malate/lactate/ureidoglycolate dehydrogenase
MQTQIELRVSIDTLYEFCRDILLAAGVPRTGAEIVAESLTQADAAGLYSHGSVRLLPVYVRRILAGTTRATPNVKVVRQMGSVTLLDGDGGLGQVVGSEAMRNSSHFGASSYFAKQAIAAGMIGMVMTNAPSNMPPWGGRKPYFGTNPLCVALPCGDEAPVILDMSTSVVARGKIVMAAATGKEIPAGWAIDRDGNPTQNAQAALEGAVLPVGGYKGSGLAMIIDALCGVLTGAAFGTHIVNLYDEGEHVQNLGHFFLALNVEALMPLDEFRARMDHFVQEIHLQPRMPGVDYIYVPGELEFEAIRKSYDEGIVLPGGALLEPVAKQLGVTPLHLRV